MSTIRWRGATGLALALAAAACIGGKTPQMHYYVPRLPAAQVPPDARSDAGLQVGVAPFTVDAPYDGDRIVYRVGEDSPEVGFYAYHRWAAPLARTIPELVAERLAGTAGIASIEPELPGRRYAARLEGRILAMEEVDTSAGPGARVRLWLALIGSGGDELWSKEMTTRAQAGASDMRAVVEALGRALAEAVDLGRRDLEQTLAR